ncbi:hypothetical protein M0811_06940 [Anaeramoeba ignava]|uniref:Uncharacterized protein n=1 Tax=Anaeramoeba ignava TaxID=1746090 RepID=A0A9Q0RDY4_ANAIG|nr:hypothetical protein M0811_06940 [Anaeramoeba ignava]
MIVTPNNYSWDGSVNPTFPLSGLYDDYYNSDPLVLPPGNWDWNETNHDTANLILFLILKNGNQFGWRFIGNDYPSTDWEARGDFWQGSSGLNWANLGTNSALHSTGGGNLGNVRFKWSSSCLKNSWSLDFRTGDSNDLVLIGYCDHLSNPNAKSTSTDFHFQTATIHTKSGADRVYVRDISRAAIDLGNGANGRTDTVDATDGDDVIAIHGNSHDFRIFGGAGNDVVFWYIDENLQSTAYLGPNFFGTGSWGSALWRDSDTDRLVLVIPTSTEVIEAGSTPAGKLRVVGVDSSYVVDTPTEDDVYARYCITCGVSSTSRKTLILEYRDISDQILTGYFYVTDFEEIQVGVGQGAKVYEIDDVNGHLNYNSNLQPLEEPNFPSQYCQPIIVSNSNILENQIYFFVFGFLLLFLL